MSAPSTTPPLRDVVAGELIVRDYRCRVHKTGEGTYWAEVLGLPADGAVSASGATFRELTEDLVKQIAAFFTPEEPCSEYDPEEV